MTEPTDAELDTVLCNQWPAFSMQATLVRVWVRAAMRDALAKWGTPPAVAGEPVATLHCNQDCYVWARATEAGKLLRFEDPMNLYTTPQPTQAQAGAVPLTPKQVAEIADAAHREYDRLVGSGQCAPRWSAVFAHLLERAHGIGTKGNRHE